MNRRLCVWVAALGIGSVAPLAMSQTPPAAPGAPAASALPATMPTLPTISAAVKASTAPTEDDKKQITAAVSAAMNLIATGSPAEQKFGRDAILRDAPLLGAVSNVTPAYLNAYAAIIDQQLVALLKSKPPLRVRLIAAVVAARVAEHAQTFQLAGSATLLLQDEDEAIVLWGMKAAKFVLPQLIAVQGAKIPLLQAMVATGLKFPGPVLAEAYDGLVLNPMDIKTPKKADAAQAQIAAVIPAVHALLQARLGTYGPNVPVEPNLDASGTGFLVIDQVWRSQSPAQQKQSIMLIHDLLMKAATVFAVDPDRTELTKLISRLGSALSVVGTPGDSLFKDKADAVRKINRGMDPARVLQLCTDLAQAAEQLPVMQTVTQGGPATRATSGSSPEAGLAVIK